jgi:hypothetical protein
LYLRVPYIAAELELSYFLFGRARIRSSGPHFGYSHTFTVVLLGYARKGLGQNVCCEKSHPFSSPSFPFHNLQLFCHPACNVLIGKLILRNKGFCGQQVTRLLSCNSDTMGTVLHKVLRTMDNINHDLAEILSNDI